MDKKEFEEKGIDLCPKKLPRGMGEWLRGIVKYDNVLLYKKGGRKGFCYACGHEVHAEPGTHFSMKSMKEQHCPRCGQEVLPILDGTGTMWAADYYLNAATIQPGKKDTVWIRLWHVNRVYGRTLRIKEDLHEVCRWGINGRQVVKWQKELNMRMGWSPMNRCEKQPLDKWTRMGRPADVYDGSYTFYAPPYQEDRIRTGPLQYANILGYLTRKPKYHSNVIRWLVEFARYPAFEKIDKAGFLYLSESKVHGDCYAKAFSWSKDTLEEFLGFPLRLIKNERRETITFRELRCIKIVWNEFRKGLCKETEIKDIADVLDRYVHRCQVDFREIDRLRSYVPIKDAVRYAEKKEGRIRLYLDYLDQCKQLNLDLSDRKVLYPKHLANAHTRTNSMIRYKADEALRKQFSDRVKRLKKMAWTAGSFLIRPAASQKELIREGELLEHCVGGYAARMAKGQTAIFLIRKVDDPGTPFYTLEYRDGQVIQCRGYQNRGKEKAEGLTEFVEAWAARMSRKAAAA